jgi:hypothetical protein
MVVILVVGETFIPSTDGPSKDNDTVLLPPPAYSAVVDFVVRVVMNDNDDVVVDDDDEVVENRPLVKAPPQKGVVDEPV